MSNELVLFALSALVAMTAALSAGAINKQDSLDKPVGLIILGNISALILIIAAAFGFSRLSWWIPLTTILITVPIIHHVLLQRIMNDKMIVIICGSLSIISLPFLIYNW